MDLTNKRILIAAQYAAPYGGNFLRSIQNLSDRLKADYNCAVAFVFPYKAFDYTWCREFVECHDVRFVDWQKHLKKQCRRIVDAFVPDIVYTHFEGFDLPMYQACRGLEKPVYNVWHMHDWLAYHPNLIKNIYMRLCLFRHYGLPALMGGVNLSLLAVCVHELAFVKRYRLGKRLKTDVLPNGIDMTRLEKHDASATNRIYTFGAFGGRNTQKRVDLIMHAARRLAERDYDFNVIVTCGSDTRDVINGIFGTEVPPYITLVPQTSDINSFYSDIDCFISSSSHETFSYAVAEATIVGLPVIQSDIIGTKWNAVNPSVTEFKSGDISELSVAMEKMLVADKDELSASCEVTRCHNMEFLSLDRWSEGVIQHFKSL